MPAEIRRKRTSDPEMDAMAVLVQALDPLEHSARARVLKWAEERYVRGPHSDLMKSLSEITDSWFKAAQALHVRPGEVEAAVHMLAAQIEQMRNENGGVDR